MKYLDSDGLLYFTQKIKTWLSGKVDKVDGKGLSTNDFTTTLKNKLDGISAGANVNVQADWNATSGDAFIKNKPTIPAGAKLYSSTGQNTDGAMTQKAVTDALGGKANSSHNHDDRYYTETEVDAKISDAISGVTQFDYEVFSSFDDLPTTGEKGTIYLVACQHGSNDSYDEYVWVEGGSRGNKYEKIGNTDIDLSGYATTSALSSGLSGKVDKVSGKGLSTNDFTTTLKNKLDGIASGAEVNVQSDWNATSGDALILNKPTFVAITNAEIDTICS